MFFTATSWARLATVHAAAKRVGWRESRSAGGCSVGEGYALEKGLSVMGERTAGWEENAAADWIMWAGVAAFSIMVVVSKAWICGLRWKQGWVLLGVVGGF